MLCARGLEVCPTPNPPIAALGGSWQEIVIWEVEISGDLLYKV